MTVTALRAEVREAILDATERLFQRYGYRKTTVEDIALEGGISRGTVYLYFKSKEEIALSWIQRHNDHLHTELERLTAQPERPAERLKQMLLCRVLFRFDHARHYTQSIDDLLAALRSPLLALRDRNHGQEADMLAGVLEEGRLLGEFAFDEARPTADLLILATNALMPYSLSTQQLGERETIEARMCGLIDLLLNGLRPR